MAKFKELISEVKKEIVEWKQVTDKRVQEINKVLDELAKTIKEEFDINLWDENVDEILKMFDYEGYGFRPVRQKTFNYKLMLVDIDTYSAFPPSLRANAREDLFSNEFTSYNYMNFCQIRDFIKKFPEFIQNIKNVIDKEKTFVVAE